MSKVDTILFHVSFLFLFFPWWFYLVGVDINHSFLVSMMFEMMHMKVYTIWFRTFEYQVM